MSYCAQLGSSDYTMEILYSNVATTPSPKEHSYCSEQLLGSFIITLSSKSQDMILLEYLKRNDDSKGNSKRKVFLFYICRVGGREWVNLPFIV